MASLFAESFEEGTNGTAMTTGNSGFTSLCTNWTFTNSHVLTGYGSLGGRSHTTTSGLAVGQKSGAWTAAPVVFFTAPIYPVTLPGADTTILQLLHSGTDVADLRLTSTGALKWRDSSFIARGTSGALLSGGNKFARVRGMLNATTGKMQLQVFAGANASGTTPDYDSGLVSVAGLSTVDSFEAGIVSSAVADIYWSHLEFDSAAYPGPAGNTPPTCSASASPTPATAGTTVTLSGIDSDPDGTIASRAWTQTSGTTVTLTGSTTATATFTAPSITGGGNLTFSYQVTDNLGATATSTVTVGILSSTASIALRGTPTQNTNATTGANTTGTVPAATLAGDKILAIFCDSGTTITPQFLSDGWQSVCAAASAGSSGIHVWQKTAVTGDAGKVLTVATAVDGTSSYKRIFDVVTFSGARMGNALAVQESTAGTAHVTPGQTAVSASAWTVNVVADFGSPSSTGFTLSAGTVLEHFEHVGGAAVSSVVFYRSTVGAGTVGVNTATGTLSTANASMATVVLEPGSPANPPPNVVVGPEQDNVEPFVTVTVGGTDTAQGSATIASVLWEQISGADVSDSMSDPTLSTLTFTAPPTVGGSTVVLQKTVTDSTGISASAQVLVAVLPVTERAVVGGAEIPLRMFFAG